MKRERDMEEVLQLWGKAPVREPSPHFVDAVMRKIRTTPLDLPWWRRCGEWVVEVATARVAVVVATSLLVGVLVGHFFLPPGNAPTSATNATVTNTAERNGQKEYVVKFVLVDRTAKNVSLVGDFNRWSKQATPMQKVDGGVWTVTVPLTEGQYNYQFVVDGVRWVTDPTVEETVDDGFGHQNSVLSL